MCRKRRLHESERGGIKFVKVEPWIDSILSALISYYRQGDGKLINIVTFPSNYLEYTSINNSLKLGSTCNCSSHTGLFKVVGVSSTILLGYGLGSFNPHLVGGGSILLGERPLVLLMWEKFPCNKRGHFPFCRSQLEP